MTASAIGGTRGANTVDHRDSWERTGVMEPNAPSDAPSPKMLRRAFGSFATGVAIIGALGADGDMAGMTVNSLTSVSISPPLILFCAARSLIAFDVYATTRNFSISILSKQSEVISNHFARSGVDKWKTVPHRFGKNGAPYLDNALATLECAVVDRHEAGDHLIVLGRVMRLNVSKSGDPLVFFRSQYRSLEQNAHSVAPGTQSPFEPWG